MPLTRPGHRIVEVERLLVEGFGAAEQLDLGEMGRRGV